MEKPESNPGRIRLGAGVFVPESALSFRAVRSSGPGGQNVNKRSTKVELRVRVDDLGLNEDARRRLQRLAGSRLTADGELILTSEGERSQRRNREEALARLRELVVRACTRPKKRVATKPTRGSRERRLQSKRERGEKKESRRPPNEWS